MKQMKLDIDSSGLRTLKLQEEQNLCANCHESIAPGSYYCDKARKPFCYACMHNKNFYERHTHFYGANKPTKIMHQEWKLDKIEVREEEKEKEEE